MFFFLLDSQHKVLVALQSFSPEDGVICEMQCINRNLHWVKLGDYFALDVEVEQQTEGFFLNSGVFTRLLSPHFISYFML